jgi:hypothetical protein
MRGEYVRAGTSTTAVPPGAADERQRGEHVSEQTHRDRIAIDNPDTQRVNQPGREEGVVRAGAHPVEHEEPADWGWHGQTGRKGRIAAWLAVLVTLSFLVGNHEGRVEDLWVLGTAVLLSVILVWDIFRRRNAWRSR